MLSWFCLKTAPSGNGVVVAESHFSSGLQSEERRKDTKLQKGDWIIRPGRAILPDSVVLRELFTSETVRFTGAPNGSFR